MGVNTWSGRGADKTFLEVRVTKNRAKLQDLSTGAKNRQKGVRIESDATDENIVHNEYCNVASIVHTENEFVFDFHFQLGNKTNLVSRVITNPKHAKAFLIALEENMEKYESHFGTIELSKGASGLPSDQSEKTHLM